MSFLKFLWLTSCLLCLVVTGIFAQTCPRTNPIVVNTTANTGQTLSWAVGCLNNVTTLTQINVNVGSGIIRVNANLQIPSISKANAVINGNGAIIDGTALTTANALLINAQNVTINGLIIRNFSAGTGIRVNAGNDATLTGNTLIDNQYGIFVARSAANVDILNNNIGNNGATDGGNSAAGIFFETLGVTPANTPPNVSNNIIAYNGVGVDANNTRNVLISNNEMYCNVTNGINRSTAIATPIITSAGTTVVKGSATPGATLEIFAVDNGNCIRVACQGRTYLGKAVATTSGQWTLFTTGLKLGQNVTATQTLNANNTSEFATCIPAFNLCSNLNAAILKTDVLCNGGATGAATVLVNAGSAPLRLNWSTGSTAGSISNLKPGNYDVTITDGNNCTVNPSTTINEPPVLAIRINTTDETQVGKGDGTASAIATGGVAPYSYLWNFGATTSNLINLKPGIYSLTVVDDKKCSSTKSVTIKAVDCNGFTASTVLIKQACFGQSDGQAMVNASRGVEPYVFQWGNQRTGSSFRDLAAGGYAITATDSRGCTTQTSISVPGAAQLSVKIIGTNPSCFGDSTGRAIVVASGGKKPYRYTWGNGATKDTLFKLPLGTYKVAVVDSNACVETQTGTLTQAPALILTLKSTNETQVGKGDGTASSTISGGVKPYQYLWSNGTKTPNVSNLKTGAYTLVVTDSNRCTISQIVSIGSINCNGFTASANWNKRACNGISDGQATVGASGGVEPYVFQWSNQRTGSSFKDLAAGNYAIIATDANGCTTNTTVVVPTATPIKLQVSGINPACFGASTGQAAGIVSGGNAPYKYLWSNGAVTNSITQLPIGTYTLAVTDSNVCEVKNSVTLTQPIALTLILTGNNETQVGKSDGTAKSTFGGGIAPYQYRWSNGATTSNIIDLKTGVYSLTVTDANQCTITQSVTIGSVNCSLFSALAAVNKRVCSGLSDGQATVSALGGVAPYVFQWSNQKNGTGFKDLAAGIYGITATDSRGCSTTTSVNIPVAKILSLQLTPSNPACFGASTGQILGNTNGGNAPYVYVWSNGATSASINQLPIGTYNLVVTDSNACVVKQSVVLTQPAALSLALTSTNETQVGKGDGTASSTVSGGIAPYQYLWSNSVTTANLSSLKTATYTLTVTDANRCTVVQSVTLSGANCNGFSASAVLNKRACSGLNDGQASVTAIGGTAPYTYQWSNQRSGTSFKDLVAGAFTITVNDAKGCSTLVSILVPAAKTMTLQLASINPSCFGSSTGKATPTLSGGNAPFQYAWSNGASSNAITQIPIGVYNLAVTDSNRCVVNGSVTLTQPTQLKISLTSTPESQSGKKDGSIAANISGGVSPFQVLWNTGATGANLGNLASGNYLVTVTDANGCKVSDQIVVGAAICAGFTISTTVTKGSCSGANDGQALITTIGGQAPFVFQWSNGRSGNKQSNLSPGTYQITTTDARGCVASGSVSIVSSSRTPRPAYGLIAPDTACAKTTLTLSVDDLWPNPAVRYIWELPNGDSVVTTSRELRIPNASPKNGGDYFVARDSGGCVSPVFGPVIVSVLGIANGQGIAGKDTTLCSSGATLTLKATLPSKTQGKWTALDGGTISNPAILNPTVGNFKTGANRFVWSLNQGKCAALFSDTVIVFLEQKPLLEDDYYQIAKVQDIAAMNVLLNDNIVGVQEIKLAILNPPKVGVLEFVPSNKSYRYTAPDEFRGAIDFQYVVCNAKAKCVTACDTAAVRIDVFNLPTPTDGLIVEDPGLNGQLIIRGLAGFTQVSIDIFNRWGDVVYRNTNYDNGIPWKGTLGSNGNFLPPGAYYFVMKAFDGNQQVGKPQTGVIHLFLKKEN